MIEILDLVNLTVDPSTNNLALIHYVSKVGKLLKKKFKREEKVVDLHGFSSSAPVLRFKSVGKIFNKCDVVAAHLPSYEHFETVERTIDFKILSPAQVDDKKTK